MQELTQIIKMLNNYDEVLYHFRRQIDYENLSSRDIKKLQQLFDHCANPARKIFEEIDGFRKYTNYEDFIDSMSKNREAFERANQIKNGRLRQLLYGYISEVESSDGNYKVINGLLRGDMIDDVNKTVTFIKTDGSKEIYSFSEFEKKCNMSIAEYKRKQLGIANEIVGAMSNCSIGQDVQLLRGVNMDALAEYGVKTGDSAEAIFEKLKSRGKYVEKGFMSTMPSLPYEKIKNANSHTSLKNVFFELDVKKETKGIDLSDINGGTRAFGDSYMGELEVLLQPGLAFEPIGYREESGKIFIHMVQK